MSTLTDEWYIATLSCLEGDKEESLWFTLNEEPNGKRWVAKEWRDVSTGEVIYAEFID